MAESDLFADLELDDDDLDREPLAPSSSAGGPSTDARDIPWDRLSDEDFMAESDRIETARNADQIERESIRTAAVDEDASGIDFSPESMSDEEFLAISRYADRGILPADARLREVALRAMGEAV